MGTGETKEWALYGGAGFIGQHLAHSILASSQNDCVTLLDIREPGSPTWKVPLADWLEKGL